jgi:hypothetical protein
MEIPGIGSTQNGIGVVYGEGFVGGQRNAQVMIFQTSKEGTGGYNCKRCSSISNNIGASWRGGSR